MASIPGSSSRCTGRAARSSTRGRASSSGAAEDALGRIRVTSVQEAFSQAATATAPGVKPGDRFRASSDKVHLVLLPLLGGVREGLVEAAIQELVERLGATGRFRVSMGDRHQRLPLPGGHQGRGLPPGQGRAAGRAAVQGREPPGHLFQACPGQALHGGALLRLPQQDPAISTAFFVPPSIRSAAGHAGRRFSAGGGPANPPQAKQRSLLARLLGGDLEAGSYSSGEGTIPLRQVARFTFPVLAMDVAVAPADRIPRMAVSDGDQVYMYKIVEQRMEPEWTKSVRFIGRTISVQLADLDGDGVLEVIGNRYDEKVGLNSFVLAHQERQAHVPGGEHRRFPLRRRSQGRRRQADAVDAAVQQDGVLHSRSGGPGDHQEGQAGRGEAGAGAAGLPAHGCGLLQYHGQGHPLARLRRRVQSPPGLDRGRGAMAVHHVGGGRLHGGRAGVHVQLANDPDASSTRSSPHRWPSTSTATAWRSSSSPRTR